MENLLQNKAKFFAQYWDQKVMTKVVRGENKAKITTHNAVCSNWKFVELVESSLELKPLSSITKEDALMVYRFHYPIDKWDDKEERDLIDTKEAVDWLKNHYNESGYIKLTAEGSDYLRSSGYAIDWNGLKVKEIENFGWIKLKSE